MALLFHAVNSTFEVSTRLRRRGWRGWEGLQRRNEVSTVEVRSVRTPKPARERHVFRYTDNGEHGKDLPETMSTVTLLDYGAGNVRSVRNAIRALGFEVRDVASPADILAAEKLVFPGVGAFGSAVGRLQADGYFEPLRRRLLEGKPFFGICIGLQVLFEGSEESLGATGLGIIRGQVRRFPAGALAVPHMGWNGVNDPAALGALRRLRRREAVLRALVPRRARRARPRLGARDDELRRRVRQRRPEGERRRRAVPPREERRGRAGDPPAASDGRRPRPRPRAAARRRRDAPGAPHHRLPRRAHERRRRPGRDQGRPVRRAPRRGGAQPRQAGRPRAPLLRGGGRRDHLPEHHQLPRGTARRPADARGAAPHLRERLRAADDRRRHPRLHRPLRAALDGAGGRQRVLPLGRRQDLDRLGRGARRRGVPADREGHGRVLDRADRPRLRQPGGRDLGGPAARLGAGGRRRPARGLPDRHARVRTASASAGSSAPSRAAARGARSTR